MKRIVWLMLLIPLLLAGCRETEEVALVETAVPTATATMLPPTKTEVITLEPTAEITKTPRPIELNFKDSAVQDVTALPEVEPITLENLDRLRLLAQWGYGTLYDVQLTADETQVVAATATGFYWFDAVTLEQVKFVPFVISKNIARMKLSPSLEYAAYIDGDHTTVDVANPNIGEILYTIDEEEPIRNLWFSGEGDQLFLQTSVVRVWDITNNNWTEAEFPFLSEIVFAQTGPQFAAAEWADVYVSVNGELEKVPFETDNLYLKLLAVSSDGHYIVMGSIIGASIKVWDTQTNSVVLHVGLSAYGYFEDLGTLIGPTGSVEEPICACNYDGQGYSPLVTYGAFTPDDRYLILTSDEDCGSGSYLYRFDMSNGTLLSKEKIRLYGSILPFSDNDRFLVWRNGIDIYQMNQEGSTVATDIRFSDVSWMEFSPDSQSLGVASWDRVFRLCDVETGQPTFERPFFGSSSTFAFLNQSNQVFLTNYEQYIPATIDLDTNQVTVTSDEPVCFIDTQDLSFDDELFHYSTYNGAGIFYSIPEDEWLGSWETPEKQFHPFKPEVAELVPEGIKILSFDGLDFTLIKTIPSEYCNSSSIQWGYLPHGEGFYCFIGEGFAADRLVFLRDDESLMVEAPLITGYGVQNVVFSGDGSLMFVYLSSNLITVFEVNTGVRFAEITTGSAVHRITLSPDGKVLAVAIADGLIQLWGVPAVE